MESMGKSYGGVRGVRRRNGWRMGKKTMGEKAELEGRRKERKLWNYEKERKERIEGQRVEEKAVKV